MLARIAAAVLAFAPLAQVAIAQSQEVTPSGMAENLNPPLNIDFAGGTLGQFVDALSTAMKNTVSDGFVNVVFADAKTAQYPVPAIKFRRVTLESALKAVANPRLHGKSGQVPVVDQVSGRAGAPVYVISTADAGVRIASGEPAQHVEVFDIRDLARGGTKVETVLTAVETAIRMEGANPEPQVKFHEDSGLLILRATNEQIDSARQVVGHMTDAARGAARQDAARERQKQIAEVNNAVELLYAKLSDVKATEMTVRHAADQAKWAVSQANDPAHAQQARAEVDRTSAELIHAQLATEKLERELRMREQILAQLRAVEMGVSDSGGEVARLRAENAELRSRIGELEKKTAH
jgi:hypothetical protein